MKKTHLFRVVALFLLLVLTALPLVSCDTGSENPQESTSGDETTTQGTEVTTAEPVETEPPLDSLSISAADLSLYRIIYPQNATEDEMMQALLLQMEMESRYGVALEMRDDFVREGTDFVEIDHEILVGRCNRAASASFYREMRTGDYGYGMKDRKLVIVGGSASATVEAVETFMANALGEGDVFYANTDRCSETATYAIDSVLLEKEAIGRYAIVYPKGDASLKSAAEYLAEKIENDYAYKLDVRNDAEAQSEHEILLGDVARDVSSVKDDTMTENDYLIAAVGGSVWLTGESATMVYRAIDGFLGAFEGDAAVSASVLTLELPVPMKVTCSTSTVRSMTFNIRCAEYTDERIALVFRMIDLYAPDTIGFQEATVQWMGLLRSRLGDRYGYVGVGRNADHSGEASPVFYLKSKFELIEGGTKWMTSTPDVAGSKIPESSLPRVFSYAVLRVIATGQTLVHVNTHLEHTSEEAREIQAGYLVEFLEQYRESGATYIVSGDFNSKRGAAAYTVMANAGLTDALNIAKEAIPGTTYHGYGKTSSVIDHIFVSQGVDVSYYKACTETFKNADGSVGYPSDHNPVIIDYEIR